MLAEPGREPVGLEQLASEVRGRLEPVAAADEDLSWVDEVTLEQLLLFEDDDVHELHDGRLVLLPALLEGLTLTHRLTEDEASGEWLARRLDLLPLELVSVDGRELASGGVVSVEEPLASAVADLDAGGPTWWLAGPDGWLGGAEPGDLVALRWTGVLEVSRLDEGPELEAAGEHAATVLRSVAASLLEQERAVEVLDLVIEALVAGGGVLRTPAPPLSELLDRAGLSVQGDWVGLAGIDWREWRSKRSEALLARKIQQRHGLSDEDTVATLQIVGAAARHAEGDERAHDPNVLAGLVGLMAPPTVTRAVAGELVGPDDAGLLSYEDAESFAADLEEVASGPMQAGPRYLRTLLAELRDAPQER